MSLPVFFRGVLPDLWIGLSTSEALGLVDGVSFVQDSAGAGGHVSLRHVPSGVTVAVPVAVWGSSASNLGGRTALAPLLAGEYRIEGMVESTQGDRRSFSLAFILADGPAPENGLVTVPGDAPGTAIGILAPLDPAAVAVPSPSGSVRFPAADAPAASVAGPDPSVVLPALDQPLVLQLASADTVRFQSPAGPAVVAVLQPGLSLPFPVADLAAVAFPPLSPSVRF